MEKHIVRYRIYDLNKNSFSEWKYKKLNSKDETINFISDIRKDQEGEFEIYILKDFITDDIYI